MKLLEKLSKKLTDVASTTMTESIKTSGRDILKDAVPTILTVGGVLVGGIMIFRGMSHSTGLMGGPKPSLTRTTNITYNYFFDPSVQGEVLEKIINNGKGK